MKFFPESALVQLEFEKVKTFLALHCRTEYAKIKTNNLRIHTKKEIIETALQQNYEFTLLLKGSIYFPNDFLLNLYKELKLIAIPGAVLNGEQFLHIRKLANNAGIFFGGLITNEEQLIPGWQK